MKFLGVFALMMPCVSWAVDTSEFQSASKLLVAARRGDIQTVQILINNGANVNYVDSTGLSLVCTAVMNNDTRAIQILQMYGADASNCDKQIKQYKQKSRVAAKGEEYGFFSGLSSTHIIALSAVGVAAVVGGIVLLADVFDDDDGGGNSGGSNGDRPNNNDSESSSATKSFTVPYGPAYLTSAGAVDTTFDITTNLSSWDDSSNSELRKTDFNYLRTSVSDNFASDGLVSTLQNYLLMMGGYYSFASGYMGQNIFRDSANGYAPVLPAIANAQARPVRVALITGNGINPAGSADSAGGITYALSTSLNSATPHVDKYLNNTATPVTDSEDVVVGYDLTENTGFDFSGSGSAFNPYANVNDSALAKIVAGWEGERSSTDGDLYGFVPNGQLAIYRTGNGTSWDAISTATDREEVGTFTDTDGNDVLSATDVVVINGNTYNIVSALDETSVTNPVLTVGETSYQLSTHSKIFIGQCESPCTNIAIYVGTDGAWYINSSGGNDVDSVYIEDSGSVWTYKNKAFSGVPYYNFAAMAAAAGKVYNVSGDTSATTTDVIANTNLIPASYKTNYLNVGTFTTSAELNDVTDLKGFYRDTITSYYGSGQGGIAHSLFNGYSASLPMIIMPAGDRIYKEEGVTGLYLDDLDATFENYAPILYGNNLRHDFMTVVAVSHETGTSAATSISGYGDGTGSAYGPIVLSKWTTDGGTNIYSSRKCGIAGTGASGIDPWCFAAAGPTAEMATAAAAGAVASIKSAFPYMTNDQVFTLLALTADGPFLAANTSGTVFSTDSLATYLKGMYSLPMSYNESSLSSADYLDAFKDVFGYGLINLERAIKPGYSIYYYSNGNIVSDAGNQFWGNVSTSTSRASSVLSLTNRGAITTSFFDVLQSADGSISLPRVWNNTLAMNNDSKHALYMGDVLADFNVNSANHHSNQIGNMSFDMAMSSRAYDDNLNGLDNLRIAFTNEKYDVDAQYQHYLTDGESRFSGRANGVLALVSNTLSTGAKYKSGNFAVGGRAFSGVITDEGLIENDPTITAQFEPGRLGFANGVAMDAGYNTNKFAFNVAVGNLHETNTVLGMYSDGLLTMRGGDTQYVDAVAEYKPIEKITLSLRGTFADTRVDNIAGLISDVSNIKSNAFAIGADVGGFSFTASMPLAVVSGKMGYDDATFEVVENNGKYEIAMNNPHVEYVDLATLKRELRFSSSYKMALGEWTDAGVGFIYRVHPNNTDVFGNESLFMFKIHHRLGI